MRVMLDTHVLLWSLAEHNKLDRNTRALLEDPSVDVLFSAASIREIAIKARLGRADFPLRPADIAMAARDTGFTELRVDSRAAALVADLPLHHRDPFDRILVAQAITEPVRLFTADGQLAAYSDLVTLIG
jgi:PIN domain nuclease of toxin-antitoxin system